MRQLLHIFKKDIRGLWGELAVFLGSLVLGCMSFRYESAQAGPSELEGSGVAELLVLVAACYLISRLIHAETIPGSAHFWLTRPYRWPSLLGAKALFILVCVHLPAFVVQAVLLWFADFPVLENSAGLLWTQVLILIWVSLPAVAIAAVTTGLVGFTLFVVGGWASLLSLSLLHNRPPGTVWNVIIFQAESKGFEWVAYTLLAAALAAAALPVLYSQYSARKTSVSRALLVGIFWTGIVLLSFSTSNVAATDGPRMPAVESVPKLEWTIQALASSGSLDMASLQFSLGAPTFIAAQSYGESISEWPPASFEGTQIEIDLPLVIRGVAPGLEIRTDRAAIYRMVRGAGGFVARGSGVRTDDVSLSVEGADGETYPVQAMVFQASQDVTFGKDLQLPLVLLIADGRVYEKLRNNRLTVRGYIDLVFVGNVRSLSVPRISFPVNVTKAFRCGLETLRPGKPKGLSCRVAFRWPLQSIDVGRVSFVKTESFSPFPASLRLNPVLYRYPTFELPESEQVDFTLREPVAYVRRKFEIHNVRLIEGPGTRTGWGTR